MMMLILYHPSNAATFKITILGKSSLSLSFLFYKMGLILPAL